MGGLKMLSLPLALMTSILLARHLGPEGFGRYAFIMSVVTIIALPVDQGMRQLVTREVARYNHGNEWALLRGFLYRAHQWIILAATLLLVSIGALAIAKASWSLQDRWTLLLAGLTILPFLGLNAVRGGTLRGLGYVVQAQIPELFCRPGFHLITIVALVGFGALNAATALASQVAAALLAFGVGALILRRYWPSPASYAVKEFQTYQWVSTWAPFTLLMAASLLNNQIGILLLGWLGTDEQVGALRIADRGAQLVAMSLSMINLVISPQITRAYKDKNHERMQALSRQSARAALLVAAPMAIPLIVFGAPIVNLVFGADYVDLSTAPLAIAASAQLINVIFGSVGMFLTMSGYERDTLKGQVFALTVNAVTAMVLIPIYGATGAAIAAAIGLVVWNLILAFLCWKRLRLRPSAI